MEELLLKNAAKSILNFDLDETKHIVAIFDTDLNYLLVNNATCALLGKQKNELISKNLLQLFPELIASVSHKNLLVAISGVPVFDVISEGHITKEGATFMSDYYPMKNHNGVYAILVLTKVIYFP